MVGVGGESVAAEHISSKSGLGDAYPTSSRVEERDAACGTFDKTSGW